MSDKFLRLRQFFELRYENVPVGRPQLLEARGNQVEQVQVSLKDQLLTCLCKVCENLQRVLWRD